MAMSHLLPPLLHALVGFLPVALRAASRDRGSRSQAR
jgi:hypothetical protein